MSEPTQSQTSPNVATRWLLSLVTVSLGGYLLVMSLSGQFNQLFTAMQIDISYAVLLILQLLFAVAVVGLGFFFAPAPLLRRVVAAAIVVGVVLLVVILQAVRLSSGFGPASVFMGFTLADAFVMLTAAFGAAWLVVRRRRGLAFAALALVVILALAHWALLVNGVDSATTQLVMLVLSALIVSAIGWGGVLTSRVLGGSASGTQRPAAQPQPQAQFGAPTQLPSPYTQHNDRPAERGPVI
jgi:hypothetical protein